MHNPALLCLVAACALACATVPAAGQGVTEWSAEARTVLSFRVPEAAVQALLPQGWTVDPSTGAANRGANLSLTVMERTLVLDPQGKPMRTGTIRYAVMSVPARHAETGRTNPMIVLGISPEGKGAYGAYLTAVVSRLERSSSATGEEAGRAEETWEFAAASGERLELRLAYRRGAPVKTRVQTTIRSGVRPDFTRSYRIDQASDVLRSLTATDRVEALAFRATGPRFAPLFDGFETLLSVTAIPWYVREISVP